MATRMQQRRGTAAQWTAANPVLAAGEIGFETDTNKFKMGNGSSAWTALQYFANAAELAAIVDGAPNLLNTLNELAAAIGDDPDFVTNIGIDIQNVATDLSTHASDTSMVHGIADTTQLATLANVQGAITDASAALGLHAADTTQVHGIVDTSLLLTTTHSDATTGVHGIADTSQLATLGDVSSAASDAADDLATHAGLELNVHGIPDTSVLVTQTDLTNAITGATVNQSALAGTGIDWNSVDERFDIDNTIATKTYADNAVSTHNDDQTNVHGIADTAALALTADVNTALALKQDKVTGVSDTEIGYLDGVTSGIQGQIDAKLATATASSTYAPIASPTFTGTVSGISKTMVGLGNVDNTSDADKPVSTATQTALDAKLSLAGGTMTGDLTLSGAPTQDAHAATKAYVDNVSVGINFHQPVRVATTENITLSGTQTVDGVSLSVGDRVLVKDQTTQTQNGIYVVASGAWTRATDADNTPNGELAGGDFTLVLEGTVNSGYGYVCSNTSAITIGTTNVTYAAFNAAKAVTAGTGLTESTPGTLAVDSSTVQYRVSGVSDTEIGYLDGVTSAIQTQLDAKAPTASPTFTGTVTVAASGVAFTDGTQTKEGVPSRTPIVQKTASYTLSALTERDSMIEVDSTSATTISIPTDATLNYPVGTTIDILQTNTGQVTIAAATPATTTVNATPGLKLRTRWSSATLFKRAANTWVVYGDLTA